MLRGFYPFVCHDCGHKFIGADIEKLCTADRMPVKCPKCGSLNTDPDSLRARIKFYWNLMRGKIKDDEHFQGNAFERKENNKKTKKEQ